MEPTGPNAEQITYWNQTSGPKWVALESMIEAQISPLGLIALDRFAPSRGERVLDVGCGCGQTSLQLGERVGSGGEVLGIDISSPMLARACARAEQAGLSQVRFENADAQTFPFEEAHFDLVFSRFGVMFFADPALAFANLRHALAPEGRLGFLCWQGLDRNPWLLVPLMAAAKHLPLPPPPEPGAPGPFSLADPTRLRNLLGAGGFARVELEPLESELQVGGDRSLGEAVAFLVQLGPLGALLRERSQTDPELQARVVASVREALEPHATPAGLRLPSAAWIVTAS